MRFGKLIPPILIFSIFSLDRLAKSLVQKSMALGDSISVLPFFNITYITNTGIAFGMGQRMNSFFLIFSLILVVALLGVLKYWERCGKNLLSRLALSLVLGGAVGNLYDRIAFGRVVDFLDFFIGNVHWPAFNAADSSICVGAFLLALSEWRQSKQALAEEVQK